MLEVSKGFAQEKNMGRYAQEIFLEAEKYTLMLFQSARYKSYFQSTISCLIKKKISLGMSELFQGRCCTLLAVSPISTY
jgi:hypothetical protein